MSPAKYSPVEHVEQCAVITWCNAMAIKWPEFEHVYAVPNGQQKSPKTAAYFKAEGLKSGVPDLCWPLATHLHHGLYIEMKRRHGGTVSGNQKKWIAFLKEQGYRVEVCRGSNEAIKVLEYHYQEYETGKGLVR